VVIYQVFGLYITQELLYNQENMHHAVQNIHLPPIEVGEFCFIFIKECREPIGTHTA